MSLYLKFTDHDRKPLHGVADYPPMGQWSEPREPVLCESGWHALRADQVAGEFINVEMYVVKLDGRIIEDEKKIVGEQIRFVRRVAGWNERTQREFACDCAERALSIFEAKCPNDDRPRLAIEVARRFARGDATRDEMEAASADASAARAAAWATTAAAWAAAWAADAANAAASAAAWTTARAAAEAAAWAVARDAADAAVRAAAWATTAAAWAADAATWATTAAEWATDAAGDAARAAAWATTAAAWAADAAGDAERAWQSNHLLTLAGLDPADFARKATEGDEG